MRPGARHVSEGASLEVRPHRFLLLQNRQGKTRLSKWYVQPSSEAERLRLESEIHRMVVSRDRKHTNFIEARVVARSPLRVRAR